MSRKRLLNILLAKVMATNMPKVAKCEVNRLKLDKYVMKYFGTRRTVFARDTERIAKVGDIVLLEELPQKVGQNVTYRVSRIVYGAGDVTDPITGLKCDKDGYWENTPVELTRSQNEESLGQELEVANRTERQSIPQDGTPV